MHNAMKCGYDDEPKRERIVQGNDNICSGYVRSTMVDENMFEVKWQAGMKSPRTMVSFVVHVPKGNAHRYFPNKAIKLRRLPIFFIFSVFIWR